MTNIIYIFAIVILSIGLYILITSDHYIKKLIGMSVFQNAVLLFYIALGKIDKGVIPIKQCINSKCVEEFSNPLPHVLMLTAIVVGFSTLSVGLAIVKNIYKAYGTVVESEILSIENS